MKLISTILFLFGLIQINAQNEPQLVQRELSILSSFQIGNNFTSSNNQQYSKRFSNGIEFRYSFKKEERKIGSAVALIIENFSSRQNFEMGFRNNNQWNLSLPYYLIFDLSNNFYSSINLSLNLPFYIHTYTRDFNEIYVYKDFNAHQLNLNLGAGLVLGKKIILKNKAQILLEVKGKVLALLALRSNDYWIFNDDVYPYLFGINIGYEF